MREDLTIASLIGAASLFIVATPAEAMSITRTLGSFNSGFDGWGYSSSFSGEQWRRDSQVYGLPGASNSPVIRSDDYSPFATARIYQGRTTLFKDIYLDYGQTHTLSFDWLAQSYLPMSDPGTMSPYRYPNHQFRVDVMWPGFADWAYNDPNTPSNYGVLENLLAPVVQTTNQGFTTSTFDLTSLAGQSVRLAFRATTNSSSLLLGVDNVMLTSAYPAPPPPPPPEPVPTPALLPGLIGMGVAALRKREQEAEAEA